MLRLESQRYSLSSAYDTFFARCQQAIAKKAAVWCCLAIDVEHFKLFNQIYGRERGDLLLSAFASLLEELERRNGWVSAHLGQDDFALLMEYDLQAIEALYGQLRQIVAAHSNTVGFSPAIGVYRLEPGEPISLNMYDKAAAAMVSAKAHSTQRICEHDHAAFEREEKEYRILMELREAIKQNQITFFLQPQCRISSRGIVGAEALVRWIRPDGTMVSPGVFIPILERNGFIAEFDKMVWEMVCRWIRSLLDRGISPVPISINVSRIDIVTMDVTDTLCDLCSRYDIPVSLLKVEITESSYAEQFDKVQTLAKNLRAKGFVTMMDDFGSGYSSLNMLENVSVDVLKLDMVFVREANIHSRRGITIVESIINMAKMMGLPIVVEGIETEEQVTFLKNLGCRYAQGYYFYRPVSVDVFEKLLADEGKLDRAGFSCKMNEQYHVREFLDDNTFTDTILNNVLGAVAFYSLTGKDLTITRFNQQFYQSIGDASMEHRQTAIQNYVVKEDWPSLYRALEEAYTHVASGGTCEIRFYKSDGSVFWFRMHFFYLRSEQDRKIFYGKVQDVTEARQQSLQFFEVLRQQSEIAMRLNLDQHTIQYVTGQNTFYQLGMPSINLENSIERTMDVRIEDPEDRRRFREFFDIERLKAAYRRAIYHESIAVTFRLADIPEPVEFSTYYIRHSKEQDLIVYAFTKRLNGSN